MPDLLDFIKSSDKVWADFMMENTFDSALSILYRKLHIYSYFRCPIVVGYTGRCHILSAEIYSSNCFNFWSKLIKIIVYMFLYFFLFCNKFTLCPEIIRFRPINFQEGVNNFDSLG